PGARAVGRGRARRRGRQRAAHARPGARSLPVAVRGNEEPPTHPIHVAEGQTPSELRANPMREVAILSAVRTAIGRAPRGVFKNTRPDDLAALVSRRAPPRAAGAPRAPQDRGP